MRYDTTDLSLMLDYMDAPSRDRALRAMRKAEEAQAGRIRFTGGPASEHDVGVARTLARMKLDADSVIAGLLHDLPELARVKAVEADESRRGGKTVDAKGAAAAAAEIDALGREFGTGVADLLSAIHRLRVLKARGKTVMASETARKMLFAVSPDLRVVLIALADKLDSVRTASRLPEDERKRVATECLDVYAPVADRLGIAWLKDELEDLALKHLNRPVYDQIKALVAGRKEERVDILRRAEEKAREVVAGAGVRAEVMSRAKHFYSIYQKMRKRAKSAAELLDLFGLRIICEDEADCYAALAAVHSTWKPVEGRFKDYIARPKRNGYRSLHTTVEWDDGTTLEVQVRTSRMHEVAEYGIASHWLYKAGTGKEVPDEAALDAVNMMKSWDGASAGDSSFMDALRKEVLGSSIVVFTPAGDAIELRNGSTPIDFAFAIHTDVGLSCAGAKVDGHIVPLDAPLPAARTVEVLTSASAKPNLNWLRIVRSPKARSRIKQWLIDHGQALAIERNIVAKRRPTKDEGREAQKDEIPPTIEMRASDEEAVDGKRDIEVQGSRGMMIRLAGCCHPVAGDPIIGFVSRGRGISVHRRDCGVVARTPDFRERSIECAWVNPRAAAVRRLRVVARADAAIFSEIENAIRKSGSRLLEGRVERDGDRMRGRFAIGAPDRDALKRAVRDLRSLPMIFRLEYE